MKKTVLLFILIVSGFTLVFAEADEYLATTRWVAAIAELAGLPQVRNFAPDNMTHPPEYELKPTDIASFSKAKAIFNAGYEGKMISKIQEALKGGANFITMKIRTDNSLENLRAEAGKVAEMFGTVPQYRKNINEVEELIESMKAGLKKNGLYGKTAYVHEHQVPLAKNLGFEVIGVFGSAPVSANQIGFAAKEKPAIIIDNYHNMVGGPLLEVSKTSKYVSLLNFPGLFNTKSIIDVFKYNEALIMAQ